MNQIMYSTDSLIWYDTLLIQRSSIEIFQCYIQFGAQRVSQMILINRLTLFGLHFVLMLLLKYCITESN